MSRGLSVALLMALPTLALADDLDRILARDQVKAQKLISEVSNALTQADAFKNADPDRAVTGLQKALQLLRDDTNLTDDVKAMYLQRVQTKLRQVQEIARARRQVEEEARLREEEKVLREKRLADQAKKVNSPVTQAKDRIFSTKDQVAALDRLRDMRARNLAGVLNDVAKSATTIEGFVEFPTYWAQLTETRKQTTGNALTKKEIELLRALNSTMSVDFNNSRFRDVLDYVMEKAGLGIIVDDGSLKDAMVEYDDPITFKVKKATVRTILKKVLADKGLTYIIKEGTIQVMTPQKAREQMVVRTYPIDDLVGGDPQQYGPFLARQIRLQNVQNLINTIQRAIDPGLWDVNGGPGSITYYEPGNALVIRAPAEMHYMMGGGGMFK